MSVKDNYPNLRPSLALNFAQTKTLDPRITFSRASTGTYYDGVTHAKAEENLLTYSEDFGNGWTLDDVTLTSNDTTAPDGTTTADLITANANNTGHFVVQVPNLSVGTYYFSVYVKANTEDKVALQVQQISGVVTKALVYFDLTDEAVESGQASTSLTGSTITAVGNGWYHCVMPAVVSSSGNHNIRIFIAKDLGSGNVVDFAGGTEAVYLWGAQLEQRSSVTAYTATTDQPITNYIPVLQSAAAGEARFDHDPVTGESKGLLIEEQRTNLVPYSEDFSNAAWSKTNVTVTSNTIVAPDGTLTADKIQDDSTNGLHRIRDFFNVSTSAVNYVVSVYLKMGTQRYVSLKAPTATSTTIWATYDLLNGTIAGSTFPGNSVSIIPVGNGWYRCSVSRKPDATANTPLEIAFNSTGVNPMWPSTPAPPDYAGTGSYFYVWGGQAEQGSFPTSYIKTTSAQATRNADSASMTGTNFSEWYRQDEGSIYAQCETFRNTADGIPISFNNLSSNNSRIGFRLSSSFQFEIIDSGSTESELDAGTPPINTDTKLVGAYKFNDTGLSLDGSAAVTDSTVTIPAVSQAVIGASATGTVNLNGTIKRLTYYPARLTNAQLQALTEG